MNAEINNLQSSIAISLTDSAAKEVRNILSKESQKKPLRIGVKNGGCAGFSYIFEFDNATETDIQTIINGINVVIDPLHLEHIQKLSIDFENGLNNRGFTFNNPDAQSTCGCGTSFA